MKVNFNVQSKSNINFGIGLQMDEANIEHYLGKAIGGGVRKARPDLEELARNCDINIKPIYEHDQYNGRLHVQVTKITQSPILKIFRFNRNASAHTGSEIELRGMRAIEHYNHSLEELCSSELIKLVKRLKQKLRIIE